MMRLMRHCRDMLFSAALVVAAVLAQSSAQIASAQFYDLDGAYRCLETPDAACAEGLRDRPQPAQPSATTAAPKGPSLDQAIAKVRAKTAGAADIAFLEKEAAANEPRAVEVLAWCKLNGIATPRDAVAAYWLYRQAAALGVANARRNQIAVFEHRLTSEERQQVAARENAQ
jgi:TPR repeat protein